MNQLYQRKLYCQIRQVYQRQQLECLADGYLIRATLHEMAGIPSLFFTLFSHNSKTQFHDSKTITKLPILLWYYHYFRANSRLCMYVDLSFG